jgi:hypothetical protein
MGKMVKKRNKVGRRAAVGLCAEKGKVGWLRIGPKKVLKILKAFLFSEPFYKFKTNLNLIQI